MLKYSYVCVSIALVRVNIAVVKHHGQKQLGKQRRVYLPSCPDNSSLREAKAGTQIRQEPVGKSWSRGNKEILLTDLLHLPGSTCFLMLPKTMSPGVSALTIVTTQNWLSLCNQLLIKHISYRLTDNPGTFSAEVSSSLVTLTCMELSSKVSEDKYIPLGTTVL